MTDLYTFQIVIEKEAEGDCYTAYSPTLAGCFRRAATVEEAKQNIREALRERLESLLARGEPITQCERLVHVEELSFAIATPEAEKRQQTAFPTRRASHPTPADPDQDAHQRRS